MMEKEKKKVKARQMLVPAGFLFWSLIYTLLVLYEQPTIPSHDIESNQAGIVVKISSSSQVSP